MHGALHIFDTASEIIKVRYNGDECLKTQISKKIKDGEFPIIVSEGTSEQKKSKIIQNAYLKHCFESLSQIEGSLIIFGTRLKKSDSHIKEAIQNSKITSIYIGLNKNDVELKKTINSFKYDFEKLGENAINFYDYNSVSVWKNKKI